MAISPSLVGILYQTWVKSTWASAVLWQRTEAFADRTDRTRRSHNDTQYGRVLVEFGHKEEGPTMDDDSTCGGNRPIV